MSEAGRFWEVAETARDLGHINQAVSNAVLAVIAANDAVCLFLASKRPAGDSHAAAARALQDACKGTEWEQEGAQRSRQLVEMLRQKSVAQYEGKPMGSDVAERVMKQARRFLEWASRVLPPQAAAG